MRDQIEKQIAQLQHDAGQLTVQKHDLNKNLESTKERLKQIEDELTALSGGLRVLENLLNRSDFDVPGEEKINKDKDPIPLTDLIKKELEERDGVLIANDSLQAGEVLRANE